MDLQPTDDQLALIDMVTGFASDRFPIDVVRSFGEPNGFDRDRWTELAALGTFGLSLPEGEGGVGLDFIDAVLVHEALGSALVPGPLLAATLSAGLVDGVLDGSVLPAIVDIPHDGPIMVEHFRSSDVLLMVDDDGVRRTHWWSRISSCLAPTWISSRFSAAFGKFHREYQPRCHVRQRARAIRTSDWVIPRFEASSC